MILINYTVKQLMIAAALSRNVDRTRIGRDVNVTSGYISQCLARDDFNTLTNMFKMVPLDHDTKEYHGRGTLYMMVAQLLYRHGEKENNE